MKTQVAQFENLMDDDALETMEGLSFKTKDEVRTVAELVEAFEAFCVGEAHETFERYKFGKRRQEEGELFEQFLSELRVLIKTCQYSEKCAPGILRDRVVLGIGSDDTREDLLKVRKLGLDECIDICRASETATTHTSSLRPDKVHKITGGKSRKETGAPRECNFCPYKHRMDKEECPAWGKKCKKCGKLNHHHKKCFKETSSSDGDSESEEAMPKTVRKKKAYKKKATKKATKKKA